MARRTTMYKLDVRQLEEDVALADVVGEKTRAKLITDFCEMYNIPLDKGNINTHVITYGEIKSALEASAKSSDKTK